MCAHHAGMVRCLALFALLLAAPAMAQDGLAERPAPPHGASARAEVTVTIMHGEEIRLTQRPDSRTPPPDRHLRQLPTDQIRIDFY